MSTTPSPLPLRQEGGLPAGGLLWGEGKGAGGEALEGGRKAGAGAGVGGGWWEQEGEVLQVGKREARAGAGVGESLLPHLQGAD